MATTTSKDPNGTWLAVATAGDVTITPEVGTVCYWAITENTTAPAFYGGHAVNPNQNVSMTLAGTERLWLHSEYNVFVTATAPV